MAPPRASSGAESSTSVLCIAAKPDSAAPITMSSARQSQGDRVAAKATRRNGATSTDSAKIRRCGTKPRLAAMASAPMRAPSPSAATSAPSHSGPAPSTSRVNTGSMCWYGKKSTFISTVTMSTARTVPSAHAARAPARRLAATERAGRRYRAADAAGKAARDEKARPVEHGDRAVAGLGPQPREPEAGEHGPSDLRHLHGYRLERHRARHPTRAHEGEQRGAPRGEVERPERAEEHLEPDQRPVAAGAEGEEGGQRQPGDETESLGEEEHVAPVHAVRDHAGERTQRHHRRGAREGGEPHHEWRLGELIREPAEGDQVHPSGRIETEAGEPETAVVGFSENSEAGETGRRHRCRRRGGAHPDRDSTKWVHSSRFQIRLRRRSMRVIVTGAASGIGRATCLRLARDGKAAGKPARIAAVDLGESTALDGRRQGAGRARRGGGGAPRRHGDRRMRPAAWWRTRWRASAGSTASSAMPASTGPARWSAIPSPTGTRCSRSTCGPPGSSPRRRIPRSRRPAAPSSRWRRCRGATRTPTWARMGRARRPSSCCARCSRRSSAATVSAPIPSRRAWSAPG